MKFTRLDGIRPVVLIDVDGCCVKWQSGLPYYMQKHGLDTSKALEMMLSEKFIAPEKLFGMSNEISMKFLKDYNKSKFIRYLAPYDDALRMINEMKEHWDFVAVTALGKDNETVMNRVFNLNSLFPGAFKDVFVCGATEEKDGIIRDAYIKHPNVVMFIDDLGKNLDAAYRVIPDVPRYHLIRGHREKPLYSAIECTDLVEIKNHYILQTLP
ncbi:hypothetical protein Acj9p207 [Acinetobacter phage Acj9]|uniref:Uncharacterized protein 30.2 n=1 Tax=Acinetobacter phage Acj9 TaxID=760939 RepID=E5EPZ1_9CAUD|nr:hypothetical protein Acj9p207 [Acinetobacter phage Acj9]ADG60107.1 conserved hypothetical protein [Acinetobacter phage Acj9]